MLNSNRDILVLLKNELLSEQDIEQEVEALTPILKQAESAEAFCTAHELVNRNRITSNPKKILKESRFFLMRPFRFLINKN